MPQEYQSYIPIFVLGWTIITFFAGHFIGHRSALKRDRIKEHNLIASRLRISLYKQISSMQKGEYKGDSVKDDDILMLIDILPEPEARKVSLAYADHLSANKYEALNYTISRGGSRKVGDLTNAIEAAQRLRECIKLK